MLLLRRSQQGVRVLASTSSVRSATTTSPAASLWSSYCRYLEQSPLLTKASMAAMIFAISDTTTQYMTSSAAAEEDHRWDGVRSASAASFGVVATTWLHFWWNFLEVAVGKRIPVHKSRLGNTLLKVAVDQGVGAPLYIYAYFVMTNFCQALAQSPDQALTVWKQVNAKAYDMLWPTMQLHWTVWPLVHTFNFYFTPLHHRVLVQNTVLIGWSGFLSHLNHSRLMTPDEEINVAIVRRDSLKQMEAAEMKDNKVQTERRQPSTVQQ